MSMHLPLLPGNLGSIECEFLNYVDGEGVEIQYSFPLDR